MKIGEVYNALLESKNITRLSASKHGKTGKGADAIALGIAAPYKEKKKTPLQRRYPALASCVDRLKKDREHDILLTGGALAQAKRLVNLSTLGKDENGDLILPFGYNLRIRMKGKGWYIGYKRKPYENPFDWNTYT